MAGTSLLALLDDIATVLDDVSAMTKVAAKKTAGVLGDDLALNAQQVTGVVADRELPVVFAVAKGSFVNKLILVPAALAISALAPWLIGPLLMLGGAFLCFEGAEKLLHPLLHPGDAHARTAEPPPQDLQAYEAEKVKGAVRTDFILSAEIVAITLGVVADAPFARQVGVLSAVAVLMTLGVYGLVAGIVKMDDAGLHLVQTGKAKLLGQFLLGAAPVLMRFLSVAGTAAMFLVGGGILTHGIGPLHHQIEAWREAAGGLGWLVGSVSDGVVGVLAGALIVALVTLVGKLRGASHA